MLITSICLVAIILFSFWISSFWQRGKEQKENYISESPIPSIYTSEPKSLSFTFDSSLDQAILVIHDNGKIEWRGDQSEVALKFWDMVEKAWPGFLKKYCEEVER